MSRWTLGLRLFTSVREKMPMVYAPACRHTQCVSVYQKSYLRLTLYTDFRHELWNFHYRNRIIFTGEIWVFYIPMKTIFDSDSNRIAPSLPTPTHPPFIFLQLGAIISSTGKSERSSRRLQRQAKAECNILSIQKSKTYSAIEVRQLNGSAVGGKLITVGGNSLRVCAYQ